MKRLLFFIVSTLVTFVAIFFATPQSSLNGFGTESQKRFVSGNLVEKAQVLKDSTPSDRDALCKGAISFCLSYLPLLGSANKDLNALTSTAVTLISAQGVKTAPDNEKAALLGDFYNIYTQFVETDTKVAVLKKLSQLDIPSNDFTILLNKQLLDSSIMQDDKIMAALFDALGAQGNKETFTTLFGYLDNINYKAHEAVIRSSLKRLAQKSTIDIASFIQSGDVARCKKIFELCITADYNKTETSVVYHMANVAENVLSRIVYIAENTKKVDDDLIALSIQSFQYLANLKWTRATKTAIRYFTQAIRFYSIHRMSEGVFCAIVNSLPSVAPLDCVGKLSEFLTLTNSQKETGYTDTSDMVIIAVINVLGNLGSKGAFDALLSVTYYDYSSEVLDAAKKSLARLKW